MKLYCGIDLHSNNSVVVILDEADKVIYLKKLNNDLFSILQQLSVYKNEITAIAIESTFNWYWLVDGLMDAGHTVKLVNTAAVQTYDGLKHTDDKDDARWLAHLLRLGILPTGYKVQFETCSGSAVSLFGKAPRIYSAYKTYWPEIQRNRYTANG